MQSPFTLRWYYRFPDFVYIAAKLKVIRIWQGRETRAEFFRVRATQWVCSCQAGKEDMLCSNFMSTNVDIMGYETYIVQ